MSFDRTSVSRSVTLAAPVDEVWAVVGDFHGIHKWHPGVETSVREHVGSEEFRALTLSDGARMMEHLEGEDTHAYHYAILRGPLPVRHYHATIEAAQDGAGTAVTWSSVFEPTDPAAEEKVAAIYDAGLQALAERFGR